MKRLRDWAAVPIMVPRWMLTTKYAMFAVLGAIAGVAGIPTLSLTSWEGYTTIWAAVLLISGAIAAIGSLQSRWEVTERWGVVGIAATMFSYALGAIILAVGNGHTGRAAFAWALLIITLVPAARAAQLLLRSGRPHG